MAENLALIREHARSYIKHRLDCILKQYMDRATAMNTVNQKVWLSLYFPSLAVDVFSRGRADSSPLTVIEGQGHNRRVAQCNAGAYNAGVRPGMKLGAALALASGLTLCERNEQQEQQALQQLAAWGLGYTSHVSLNFSNCVLLEVGGSRKLFGDAAVLRQRIMQELSALGYTAQLAAAPTPLGAYWLSRDGKHLTEGLATQAEFDEALASLPLDGLDLAAAILDGLNKLGIRRLGECFQLPRDGLRRRFGNELLVRLDQARGLHPDPQPMFFPPPTFNAELIMPAEVYEHEALFFGINRLILDLCGFLAARELGVQHFQIELSHPRLAPSVLPIGLVNATRRGEHLSLVARERLQQLALPAAVEKIRLRSDELMPLAARNASLFDQSPASAMTAEEFIERLRSRLGDAAVQGICQVAEHRPEYAWRAGAPGEKQPSYCCRGRPLWLLPAPKPLPPHVADTLTLQSNSERIESGWWDSYDVARDYFVARAASGETLWVFRERRPPHCWYIHGLFG